jgi:hypothetical protein
MYLRLFAALLALPAAADGIALIHKHTGTSLAICGSTSANPGTGIASSWIVST